MRRGGLIAILLCVFACERSHSFTWMPPEGQKALPVSLRLPPGWKVNDQSPSRLELKAHGEEKVLGTTVLKPGSYGFVKIEVPLKNVREIREPELAWEVLVCKLSDSTSAQASVCRRVRGSQAITSETIAYPEILLD